MIGEFPPSGSTCFCRLQQQRIAATFASADARRAKMQGSGPSEGVLASGTMDAHGGQAADKSGADPIASGTVALQDEFIFGSPKTVADKIIDECRRIGAGHIVGIHMATLTESQLEAHYKLWGGVIPILRRAEVALRRASVEPA